MMRWMALWLLIASAFGAGCTGKELLKTEKQPFTPITEIPEPSHMLEVKMAFAKSMQVASPMPPHQADYPTDFNTESYYTVNENTFQNVIKNPLSTFAVDVDTASYANVRRFINGVQLPPPDAARTEELINYFTYDYPQPAGDSPFSFTTELTDSPWKSGNRLLLIWLQGVRIPTEKLHPPTWCS